MRFFKGIVLIVIMIQQLKLYIFGNEMSNYSVNIWNGKKKYLVGVMVQGYLGWFSILG